MRFFTDQFFSEAQKTKLLENSHLIERTSVKLEGQEIPAHQQSEPVFYMEWQQEPSVQAAEPDCGNDQPVMDLSAVMVMMLVGGFGAMFVFDVLLN